MANSLDTQTIVALIVFASYIAFGIGLLTGFYFGKRHHEQEEDEMLRKWRDDHEAVRQ